jgi:predicted PurR-regulated permease PerM
MVGSSASTVSVWPMTGPIRAQPYPSLPPDPQSPFWWFRWVPAVLFVVLIVHFVYVIGRLAIVPVLASFALAYLLNPLMLHGQKRGLSRPIAAALALLVVALAGIALLAFVLPDLWEQAAAATQKLLGAFTPESAARHRASLRHYLPLLDELVGDRLEQFLRDPTRVIGSPPAWALGGLATFLSTAIASLDILLVPFFVYYILVDFGTWRSVSEELIPPRFRDTFTRLFDEVGRILESYVHGQLLIALIMAVLYAVGFAVLRVPAWGAIATLSGLLNTVPYVGTILGLALASALVLADGANLWKLGGVIGVFVMVQSLEGYYLTPRILGGRLSLHPMEVLLGLLIGGKLFGLLGILLAVPTIAVAKVFLRFARELYRGSQFYHAGAVSPAEAPSPILEQRLAEAADTALADQARVDRGEERLAPLPENDDRTTPDQALRRPP